MQINNDPVTNMVGDVSLAKGQNAAATLTGDYIDCANMLGNTVLAQVMTGVATGSPDSQSATFTLMQADTSGGSGAEAMPIQTTLDPITVDKGFGFIRGQRSKRYVAVKCVLALTNGSSPKQDVFGTIFGEKIHK